MNLKICVIGAGSTYTPELVEGIIKRKDSLPVTDLCLMDIDGEKLAVVGGFVKRMISTAGLDCAVTLTGDLDEALCGSAFVLAQIRVGKLAARILDEKIPLKYKLIGQETTGMGGFFKALRTIPVMMDIVSKMSRLCPDAFLINFSNPSGVLAEALLNHTGVKMMGLCNVPIAMLKSAREKAGADDAEIDYLGVNHLSYITSIRANGVEYISQALSAGNATTMQNIPKGGFDDDCLRAVGAIPSPYLQYYYNRANKLKAALEAKTSRGEDCAEIEKNLLAMYADEALVEKPELLNKRGGHMYSEAAISLVDAIHNDRHEMHVVNVLNNGAVDFMDDDDVLEIGAVIGKNGATPIPIKNYRNRHVIGMLKSVKYYEKLTVEAALSGSDDKALAALLVNPLVGDYASARDCYYEMKEAHREFLPQFYGK